VFKRKTLRGGRDILQRVVQLAHVSGTFCMLGIRTNFPFSSCNYECCQKHLFTFISCYFISDVLVALLLSSLFHRRAINGSADPLRNYPRRRASNRSGRRCDLAAVD